MTVLLVRVTGLLEADPRTTRSALARTGPAASRVYVSGTRAGTVVTLEKRLERTGLYRRSRALHRLQADLTALREELESAQAVFTGLASDVAQEGNRC